MQAPSNPTLTIPSNPLVHDQTCDTLGACVSVLELLTNSDDTRQEIPGLAPMSEAAKEGMRWVQMLVVEALRYEATRA